MKNLKKCEYTGCNYSFKQTGNKKYCPEHSDIVFQEREKRYKQRLAAEREQNA